MNQNSRASFVSRFSYPTDKRLILLFYYVPLLMYLSMPMTALGLVSITVNSTFLGWFLSISSILILLILLIHSQWLIESNWLIFGVAFLSGYMLEYSLVNILKKYTYHNLPLAVFGIPLLIPCGWSSAFYATSYTSKLVMKRLKLKDTKFITYLFICTLGMIYGFFLEKLAAVKELWDFHFTSIDVLGVPILATSAWGLTLANFDLGMTLIQEKRYSILLVIITVFLLNLLVAFVLLHFL